MRRQKSDRTLHSSHAILKAFLTKIADLLKFVVGHLIVEIFAASVIGFGCLFVSKGMVSHWAWIVAICVTLSLTILLTYFCFGINSLRKPQGETKLARRISKILAGRRDTEWIEYQDWLHDILLARRQLLDAKCPRWKVKLITYRRLSVFCVVVGISKVRQASMSIRRSR